MIPLPLGWLAAIALIAACAWAGEKNILLVPAFLVLLWLAQCAIAGTVA